MKVLTQQQIFDKVAKHLLTQKLPARWKGACIMFDKETGRRCAVGCLLPKRFYRGKDNCYLVEHIQEDLAAHGIDLKAVSQHNNQKNSELLHSLQVLHDGDYGKKWKRGLKTIAKDFGLNCRAISKLEAK